MNYCEEYTNLNDENHIYKSISYDELRNLIDSFGTGLIYIGGPWCKNCQAIIDVVNSIGKKRGLECIYNYDPKFTNIFGEVEDLRDCKTLEEKLKYYYLVEKLGFKSNELVENTLIPKFHCPFFIALKNGSCVGYYTSELVKDTYLHKENETEDMSVDFFDNIISLIEKVQKKELFD